MRGNHSASTTRRYEDVWPRERGRSTIPHGAGKDRQISSDKGVNALKKGNDFGSPAKNNSKRQTNGKGEKRRRLSLGHIVKMDREVREKGQRYPSTKHRRKEF